MILLDATKPASVGERRQRTATAPAIVNVVVKGRLWSAEPTLGGSLSVGGGRYGATWYGRCNGPGGKVGKKEPCDCEGGGSVVGNVETEESLDAKSALS